MNAMILATGNRHKLEEFTQILTPAGWNVLSLGDLVPGFPEPEETAPDFLGNSRIKALSAMTLLPIGHTVIADDSGLEVALLAGEPGVYSARFAQRAGHGEGDAANRTELVLRLQDAGLAPGELTPAAFVCALTMISPEKEIQVEGRCEGWVGLVAQGDHGFGYDPLFFPKLADQSASPVTFAQMPADEKHTLSHRGKALAKLARVLTTD
jgi:non-canonical purine NTP pyrophosphatase (RdgB/HAM1 family)